MKNNRWVSFFFLLSSLEGLAALGLLFAPLEWPSTTRLAAGGLAAALEVLLFAGLALSLVRPNGFQALLERSSRWLEQNNRLVRTVTGLGFLALLTAGLTLLFTTPPAYDYDRYAPLFNDLQGIARFESLRSLMAAARPLLVWTALILAQLAGALILAFSPRLPNWWSGSESVKMLLVLTLAAVTTAHWIILGFEVRLLANIPGWYWEVGEHSTTGSLFILVGLAVLSLAILYIILRWPNRAVLNLLLLVLLGYVLQVGFGFLDGRGYEYVRLKYAGTLHKSYAMRASADNASVLNAVRDYETLYGDSMFPSTKPPGVMVFYILTGKLVNAFDPRPTVEGRFEALTRFEAAAYPLISFLVVIVIYLLARHFLDERSAYSPAALYLFAANILLLPLFLDQVLYPLLFSLGVLLTLRAAERGAFWPGVWLGLCLYLAIFFSFSLLPLAAFSLLYMALQVFLRQKERPVRAQARALVGVAAGAGLLYLIFWLALNYDVITRYRHAMSVVHYYDYFVRTGAAESGAFTRGFFPSLAERAAALLLNNLDFGAAAGFPLYLLFLMGGGRSLVQLVRSRLQPGELLLPVYFLTFLALNLYGQNRGESARLWMFWMPAVVLLAGREIAQLFRNPGRAAAVLAMAQLVTVYLTFKFQDFWM